MTFLKRLFNRDKAVIEPMHGGIPSHQANNDQKAASAARKQMEAEVADDRARRGANDKQPADTAN